MATPNPFKRRKQIMLGKRLLLFMNFNDHSTNKLMNRIFKDHCAKLGILAQNLRKLKNHRVQTNRKNEKDGER